MWTVTAPWWMLWMLDFLAVCGLLAVCWVTAGWAERAADWWRDRRVSLASMRAEAWEGACDAEEPGGYRHCWRDVGHDGAHRFTEEEPPPLPPERTWEQMTSHQLPLTEGRHMIPPEVFTGLAAPRERRPAAWEFEHRVHYAAMGFDYPSGLMARVREGVQ